MMMMMCERGDHHACCFSLVTLMYYILLLLVVVIFDALIDVDESEKKRWPLNDAFLSLSTLSCTLSVYHNVKSIIRAHEVVWLRRCRKPVSVCPLT